MTPDELPADMVEHLEAVARSLGDGDFTRVTFPEAVAKKTAEAIRALLKAYQEQRRALEDLLALPVAAQAFVYLDKGIGAKTPQAAWLRARAALNQKGDER